MKCPSCGKSISDNATFCAFCGKSTGGSTGGMSTGTNSSATWGTTPSNTSWGTGSADSWEAIPFDDSWGEMQGPSKKKTNKGLLIGLIVAAVLLVFGCVLFFGTRTITERAVASAAGDFLNVVRIGPGADTVDSVIETAVPQFVKNNTVSNLLINSVHGQDLLDIYSSFMTNMNFEIQEVERVDSKHYIVTVAISNMNNKYVVERAIEMYAQSYTGGNNWWDTLIDGVTHAYNDLNSDKSELIADYVRQASDELSGAHDSSLEVGGVYHIDVVKVDGKWAVDEDYIDYALYSLGLQ